MPLYHKPEKPNNYQQHDPPLRSTYLPDYELLQPTSLPCYAAHYTPPYTLHPYPFRRLVMQLFLLAAFTGILCYFIGYSIGYHTEQHANDLLDAGFVIVDPEGREIARFDSGVQIVQPSYHTTTP